MIEPIRAFFAGVIFQIEANAPAAASMALIALNLLLSIMLEQRRRRKLGLLPAYVRWLEAKVDSYEPILQAYAAQPGGERAAAALAAYAALATEEV